MLPLRHDTPKLCLYRLLLVLCAAASIAFAHADTSAPARELMQIKLHNPASNRSAYSLALLQAILERTAPHYPPYKLTVNDARSGPQRGRTMVAAGRVANVYVSGLREDKFTQDGSIIMLRQPLMKGLLGYRSAIIRRRDAQRFAQAVRDDTLRDLVIGQGRGWEDVYMLRYNHFTVEDSAHYDNLLRMLAYQRFDAVFLGTTEAQQALAASPLRDELTVADAPIIYYPLGIVFHVSGSQPQLAQRLRDGLKLVIADGTLDALLEQHFAKAIAYIRAHESQLLVLSHPNPELLPELVTPQLLPE
jgi:hypothetical protein